ncbi:hypothetical protein Bca52824_084449 [Brassica carinata]|uniref:DUF1985 domain-containing protein n=1 Tax=Brassica carinata TaxID=52824 RepID=A0A8X7PPB1_BRACI|nr:hypothetical protein Bca52824_084449 [Brassica carinata]
MDDYRLVDDPETDDADPLLPLPDMMFAAGEEPVRVRVLTYQSSRAINHILDLLEEDEIRRLRMSPFGKIVDIAEKPAFSGRFARYMLSRQLKVEKKYEAWFRFAGKPIRFSLREFAIVTGFNCGEYPKKTKMKSKSKIKEKPYWPELFGKRDDIRVSTALKMLRRKTVTDKEIRFKVACLAIVSSVLLSTNLKMKMIKEHAEAMVDLDQFFSYPWGRLAFEMLMVSIKQRDEVGFSNDTIALKGFALALQLVMVESVPSLNEVVVDTCSSSDSDSSDDGDDFVQKKNKKKTLNPGHARKEDKKTDVLVRTLIPEDPDRPIVGSSLVWEDEVFEVKVDNLLKLLTQGYTFTVKMFKGGATKLDVERMRDIAKALGKKKRKKSPVTHKETEEENRIAGIVMSIMKNEVQRVDAGVGKAISLADKTSKKVDSIETSIMLSVQNQLKTFKEELIRSVMEVQNNAYVTRQPTVPNVNTDNNGEEEGDNGQTNRDRRSASLSDGSHTRIDNTTSIINNKAPTLEDAFLSANSHTQESSKVSSRIDHNENNGSQEIIRDLSEEAHHNVLSGSDNSQTNFIGPTSAGPSSWVPVTAEPNTTPAISRHEKMIATVAENGEEDSEYDPSQPQLCPKSKRSKLVTSDLLKEMQNGIDVISQARETEPPFTAYSDADLVMSKYTKLLGKISNSFVINVSGLAVTSKDIAGIVELSRPLPARIIDILVRFVSTTYNRETRTTCGRNPKFLDTRYNVLLFKHYPKFVSLSISCSGNSNLPPYTHYYFPFDLGNKQWVVVCFDCCTWKLTVLDCDIQLCSDSDLAKKLQPFTEMIPSHLKRTGQLSATASCPEVVIDRPKMVHQNSNRSHSGLTTILLMQTHAMFGIDICRCITPARLKEEAQKTGVMLYELHEKL